MFGSKDYRKRGILIRIKNNRKRLILIGSKDYLEVENNIRMEY